MPLAPMSLGPSEHNRLHELSTRFGSPSLLATARAIGIPMAIVARLAPFGAKATTRVLEWR